MARPRPLPVSLRTSMEIRATPPHRTSVQMNSHLPRVRSLPVSTSSLYCPHRPTSRGLATQVAMNWSGVPQDLPPAQALQPLRLRHRPPSRSCPPPRMTSTSAQTVSQPAMVIPHGMVLFPSLRLVWCRVCPSRSRSLLGRLHVGI